MAKFAAPNPVFAGNNLNYTVIVSNNGDVAARNVALTDALPGGASFVSATQTSGPAFALTLPAAGSSGGTSGARSHSSTPATSRRSRSSPTWTAAPPTTRR